MPQPHTRAHLSRRMAALLLVSGLGWWSCQSPIWLLGKPCTSGGQCHHPQLRCAGGICVPLVAPEATQSQEPRSRQELVSNQEATSEPETPSEPETSSEPETTAYREATADEVAGTKGESPFDVSDSRRDGVRDQ